MRTLPWRSRSGQGGVRKDVARVAGAPLTMRPLTEAASYQCASDPDHCLIFQVRALPLAEIALAIALSAISAQWHHRSAKLFHVARLAGSFVDRAITRHSSACLRNDSI